jgi:hypothetical protein
MWFHVTRGGSGDSPILPGPLMASSACAKGSAESGCDENPGSRIKKPEMADNSRPVPGELISRSLAFNKNTRFLSTAPPTSRYWAIA